LHRRDDRVDLRFLAAQLRALARHAVKRFAQADHSLPALQSLLRAKQVQHIRARTVAVHRRHAALMARSCAQQTSGRFPFDGTQVAVILHASARVTAERDCCRHPARSVMQNPQSNE
jgi:hypothetical protein